MKYLLVVLWAGNFYHYDFPPERACLKFNSHEVCLERAQAACEHTGESMRLLTKDTIASHMFIWTCIEN